MSEPVLETRGLRRSFTQADVTITVLRGVDLKVMPGEIVALLGPSGSGKSTLLHCVAGLDTLTSGYAHIDGTDLSKLNDRELTRLDPAPGNRSRRAQR